MQLDNPYLPPAEGAQGAGEAVIDDESCAADRCPHCGVPITFIAMLCQATPFRFRCLRCGERSAIKASGLVRVVIEIISFAIFTVITLPIIHFMYGVNALIGGLIATIFLFLFFEWYWYRRITQTGRLHAIRRRS